MVIYFFANWLCRILEFALMYEVKYQTDKILAHQLSKAAPREICSEVRCDK